MDRLATLLGLGLAGIVAVPTSGWSAEMLVQTETPGQTETSPESTRPKYSVWGAAKESLFGDVYAHPEWWRPMSLSTFFTEGWDEPWVNPPPGGGGNCS